MNLLIPVFIMIVMFALMIALLLLYKKFFFLKNNNKKNGINILYQLNVGKTEFISFNWDDSNYLIINNKNTICLKGNKSDFKMIQQKQLDSSYV